MGRVYAFELARVIWHGLWLCEPRNPSVRKLRAFDFFKPDAQGGVRHLFQLRKPRATVPPALTTGPHNTPSTYWSKNHVAVRAAVVAALDHYRTWRELVRRQSAARDAAQLGVVDDLHAVQHNRRMAVA